MGNKTKFIKKNEKFGEKKSIKVEKKVGVKKSITKIEKKWG